MATVAAWTASASVAVGKHNLPTLNCGIKLEG
jgi:hypothetical protein